MRVLAIIPVYNEADILPGVLRHLHAQGVDTYVIDNWSTDGTGDMFTRQLKTGYELFPGKPVHVYQWERILRRVEEVALENSNEYQWMMLHDADEIRRYDVYYPDLTLADGINKMDVHGYNVIDFKVYTFPPVDNGWVSGGDPEAYFTHYRPDSGYDHVAQEKCWKVYPGVGVDLGSTGGHQVNYGRIPLANGATGGVKRRVCPHKFILKHYPIRSQSHGERKVFEERKKRWHLGERGMQWHTQYNAVSEGHNFLANPKELIKYERGD